MNSSKYLFYLLPALLLLFACNTGNVDLDNPGDEGLTVIVDDLRYDMAPGAYINIQLEPGNHNLRILDAQGRAMEDTRFTVAKGGLLNVAKSEYFLWTDLYGNPELRESKLKEDWLEIDGKTYFAEFSPLPPDELYVEQRWDFGLDDDFPTDLLGWRFTDEKFLIKTKLFRKKGLITTYNSLVETP